MYDQTPAPTTTEDRRRGSAVEADAADRQAVAALHEVLLERDLEPRLVALGQRDHRPDAVVGDRDMRIVGAEFFDHPTVTRLAMVDRHDPTGSVLGVIGGRRDTSLLDLRPRRG